MTLYSSALQGTAMQGLFIELVIVSNAEYHTLPTRDPTQHGQYHTTMRQQWRQFAPGGATWVSIGQYPRQTGRTRLCGNGPGASVRELELIQNREF